MRKTGVAGPPPSSSYTNGSQSHVASPLLGKRNNSEPQAATKQAEATGASFSLAVPSDNNNNANSRRATKTSISYTCDQVSGYRRNSKPKTLTRGQQTHRATLMLLVVVITFVIAEFPISLLLLLR